MLGLSMDKLLIIMVLTAVILGPHRLPHYAHVLAQFTRQVRDALEGARTRVEEESGVSFSDEEWKSLDPRRYDPRTIIREALENPAPARNEATAPVVVVSPVGPSPAAAREGAEAPSAQAPALEATDGEREPVASTGEIPHAGPALCAACAAPLAEDSQTAPEATAVDTGQVKEADEAKAPRERTQRWVVVGGTSGHPIRRLVDIEEEARADDAAGANDEAGDRDQDQAPSTAHARV